MGQRRHDMVQGNGAAGSGSSARRAFAGEVRPSRPGDLGSITDIYNQGVADRTATCDLSGMSAEGRREWHAEHTYPYGIWVAEVGGRIAGWVALSRYDRKACFRRTATFSTYVDRAHRGQGIGGTLRRHLIDEATRRGFHTLVNRVWVNNEASIALARRYGFEEVGRMRELVYRDGQYVDCVFFQLMLGSGAGGLAGGAVLEHTDGPRAP